MSNIEKLDKTIFQGWYYDCQESDSNKFQSVSLHPNMKWNKGNMQWETFSDYECFSIDKFEIIDDDVDKAKNPTGYRKKPLATAILMEDFNVSVANAWTEFGGNPIGQIWDGMKSLGPWSEAISAALSSIVGTTKEHYEGQESKLGDVITKGGQLFSDIAGATSDYINRALIVQGSNYSYFSSSGLSFGNSTMRFVLFPKIEGDKIITVPEQLEELYPYLIGLYIPAKDIQKLIEEKKDTIAEILEIVRKDSRLAELIRSGKIMDLSEYVGWQLPPGGYASSLKSIDTINKGTLMLRIGPMYCLTNLVCESATFNFSKQMVKLPVNKKCYKLNDSANKLEDIEISPLYCEVNIALRPASKYTSKSLGQFTNGRYVFQDRDFLTLLNKRNK